MSTRPRTMARSRPPRIAYVTSSRGVGGAEELIAALVAAGETRGWQQTVLNPFADSASVALAQRCAPADYEAQEAGGILALLGVRHWLRQRLAELQPDIVHVMLFHATVLTATVRRRTERRVLTHAYGEALNHLSYPRIRTRLDRWACRRFDHISAISEAVYAFLEKAHGYPPPPLGRIRLGWSGRPHPPKASEERAPTVVCVAALRREKGHETLLRAFVEVRSTIPAARLVLVGDGPYRPQVEGMVRRLQLNDGVHLAGRVSEVWTHLADADLFALASPSEALGIAIMEAMAAGLPVVASNVGGIPELVTPGVTGELFAAGDYHELADKLIALLEFPQRLKAMSAAALDAAEAMRMDQSIDEYFVLYNRLLEDAQGQAMSRAGIERSRGRTR